MKQFIQSIFLLVLFGSVGSAQKKDESVVRVCLHSETRILINGKVRTTVAAGDTLKTYFKVNANAPYKVIICDRITGKSRQIYPKENESKGVCIIDIDDESKAKILDSLAALSIFNLENDEVLVKGGSYLMGLSDTADIEGGDEARPQHKVTVDDFYISKYEVTQALWLAVMDSNPSIHKDCYLCPVDHVSWNQIQDFINRLNKLTNHRYRLPTEAEWEYAARGGKESKGYYYSGSDNLDEVGWYRNLNGTRTVGLKKANELGLYDMSGNVSEWCSDWFEAYSSKAPATNPKGPTNGFLKAIRGGNSIGLAEGCYVFMRGGMLPSFSDQYIGFRLVKDVK